MEISFTDRALADLDFWKKAGNKSVQNKIEHLIQSMIISPFNGHGKPEPLKYDLSGKWSRRINGEHRLVYEVRNDKIIILSLKGHY
jgi:toxin YoeB